MRIGTNHGLNPQNPAQWIEQLRGLGVGSAVFPVDCSAPAGLRADYMRAAKENGVLIAEVGVWNNCLDTDDAARAAAVRYSTEQLALAEETGACCCVNVIGARGPEWLGYYPDNRSKDTYALAVDTVRKIIDAVTPKRTFYTLEPIAWMFPSSPGEYLKMIRDIDREAFAVHMDYTNFVAGLSDYENCRELIAESFKQLAPYIKSVHAKDILLEHDTPVSVKEVQPGTGIVDFAQVLRLVNDLSPDMPVFVEHLPDYASVAAACAYFRKVADANGIPYTTAV